MITLYGGMCDVCERVTLAQEMDISDYHEAAIKGNGTYFQPSKSC